MSDPRDEAAEDFESIALELDKAAAHSRTVAQHFRDKKIPAAGAHTVALIGHLAIVKDLLKSRAIVSAKFADVPPNPPLSRGQSRPEV